jgi:N-acetylglutamate synthase-like GNAT family acetyltransferase
VTLSLNIYDDLKIRLGTTEDMDEIMQLACMAAAENGVMNASKLLLARTVWPKLDLQHGLIGCIGKKDGKIEGMVILQIGTLHYTEEPCIEELVLFVHPDYRNAKGGRATKLCEFSKSVADKMGLKLIIGVFSSINTQQKVKLYERVLGPAAGSYWVYGGKTGGHEVGA